MPHLPGRNQPVRAARAAGKQCPSDAWQQAPLLRGGTLVDAATAEHVARSRTASETETPLRARLCEMLGIDTAAVANEGFAVHAPPADALLAALTAVRAAPAAGAAQATEWTLTSNRTATIDALAAVGAASRSAAALAGPRVRYLGFHPDA